MRNRLLLLSALLLLTACSDDPTDADGPFIEGEFAGLGEPRAVGTEVLLTNVLFDGDPAADEPVGVIVTGAIRDDWFHTYEPGEITPGQPVRARAVDSCFVTDALRCRVRTLILVLPIAQPG